MSLRRRIPVRTTSVDLLQNSMTLVVLDQRRSLVLVASRRLRIAPGLFVAAGYISPEQFGQHSSLYQQVQYNHTLARTARRKTLNTTSGSTATSRAASLEAHILKLRIRVTAEQCCVGSHHIVPAFASSAERRLFTRSIMLIGTADQSIFFFSLNAKLRLSFNSTKKLSILR